MAEPLPRSFLSFYFGLLKAAVTEAYGAIDTFLTFVAFVVFLLTLFSKELAHHLETQWTGLPRRYSIGPIVILCLYRVMKANYAHFEAVAKVFDQLQQPDVALVWDWPEEQRRATAFLDPTEKLILVHNRSDQYIYNIQISPIKLDREMTFEMINEIAPGAQHLTLARWDVHSSASTNYINFFGRTKDEQQASQNGWVYKKLHNRGLSTYFLKIPMVVTYESNGVKWLCEFDFNYDVGDESVFVRKTGSRA